MRLASASGVRLREGARRERPLLSEILKAEKERMRMGCERLLSLAAGL